jgi:hypothetical protein
MAGLVSSFLNGSNLVIKIGTTTVAFAQGISMSDDIGHVPIGGIGSFGYSAIEPLQYSARGNLQILRYSNKTLAGRNTETSASIPARVTPNKDNVSQDGNSMLHRVHFNPRKLILSRTFNIDIYERVGTGSVVNTDLKLSYTLEDCRLTSYSMTFTPNQAISEQVGFICIKLLDKAGGQ